MTKAEMALKNARPEIDDLFRTAEALSDQVPEDRRMSPQENQLRYVIVALVAAMQSYVSELLEQKGDELQNDWDRLTEVEKRIVAVQSSRRMELFLRDSKEEELAELHKVESLRAMVLQCAEWQQNPSSLARSAYRVKLDGFLQDNGSKTLDRTISRYGSCGLSFFNWLSKNHPKYRGLEDVLNIIIDTRNDVAHGQFERRLTLRDVRSHRVLTYRLLAQIEPYISARSGTRDAQRAEAPSTAGLGTEPVN